ncbi:NAD(P)-dependent oxidoreductase [Streptomyces armeniacus]|uniref:NAD(P)-dependent oxidoreductase n=1 Tax=Streptomyces armeniacus TaxID=83291 RepID=A0A345XIH3_9ACTN|nr:NAD(P)-dependent oxidoreductase [Streptomyces armeniacus]AXK31439.1 NAD(P)-dependent oxidoreductase [Streptomyces armeniacus]
MRILLLGHSGYLGTHVANALRAHPRVRVLRGGRHGCVRDAGGALTDGPQPEVALRADLATADPEDLAVRLRRLAPDAVINCAGAVGGSAAALVSTNARGPAVLCEALRTAAPRARLVHLGSAAEYGPGLAGQPCAESDPACPASVYGAAKLAGTLAVTSSGLDAVVLRVFNPVGPGAPATSLPGRLAAEMRRAGAEGTVRVGDLSAHRDFVDVRDVARAVVLAVLSSGSLPGVLNIGSGAARPVRTVAEGLARAGEFRGRFDERGGRSQRSAMLSWQQADIRAADRVLDWRPRHGLKTSLTDLWAATAAQQREPAL